MLEYILRFDECCQALLPKIGGKNASLGEMIRAGIQVPSGFAITTEAYQKFLAEGGIADDIKQNLSKVDIKDVTSLQEVSIRIRQLIESLLLPADIERAVRDAYRSLSEKHDITDLPVAVRSSATAEDLPTASFAGQQETFLWIRGVNDLLEKVKKCWSSLFTPRAIAYRVKIGIPHEKVLMSVGVQRMVNAKVAGVMFTLNPLDGDPSKVILEASWGLGETVVSGAVTPDRYVVDKITLDIIKREIFPGGKSVEHVVNPAMNKIEHHEVPPERRDKPCLTDEEIIELAKLGKLTEKYYKCPQDVEWAIDGDPPYPDNIFILQSRSETVWSQRKRKPVTKATTFMDYLAERLIIGW